MENKWAIIDDNGTVYDGNEHDMTALFQAILYGEEALEWDGDLKLIEIHNITR